MHAKQERVDSLYYFNDKLFLTPVYLSFFTSKQIVLLIEAAPVSTSCCLPSLLATANQISRLGEPCILGRKNPVYVGNIHDKTIQWETRTQSFSIIKMCLRMDIMSHCIVNKLILRTCSVLHEKYHSYFRVYVHYFNTYFIWNKWIPSLVLNYVRE